MLATTIYPLPQTRLDNLVDATASILEQAFAISFQKQELSHQEYKKLLSQIGWSLRESKIYLKVANAFSNFTANDLKEIEPHTIFELAKHAKKYNQVIESLKNCSHITQEKVRELIAAHRTPKKPKPDKPTIWKTGRDGEPVCRIPDIMEEDMQTGSIIQQEMDANGTIPQSLIREAIALWNDVKQGRLVVKENEVEQEESQEQEADDVNTSFEQDNANQQDNSQNICELNTAFDASYNFTTVHVSENHMNSTPVIKSDNNQIFNGTTINNLTATQALKKDANFPQLSTSNITFLSNIATTNNLISPDTQNIFPSSEHKNQSHNLKPDVNEIDENTFQAGDKVIWKNCPPQYYSWQPFQIQYIEGNMVQLELVSFLIPVDELTKSLNEDDAQIYEG